MEWVRLVPRNGGGGKERLKLPAMTQLSLLTSALLTCAVALSASAQPVALKCPESPGETAVTCKSASFKGREALQLADSGEMPEGREFVVVAPAFHNGEIRIDLVGEVLPNAPEGSRGFVGLAFRISPQRDAYEVMYLRPANGRADDQLRRNHSVQYQSIPDYPWHRLRKETPGQYETYADIELGRWHTLRLVVDGVRARLFVDGATQPTLIVNDMKRGDAAGDIGLWIGSGTLAHFSNLSVTSSGP